MTEENPYDVSAGPNSVPGRKPITPSRHPLLLVDCAGAVLTFLIIVGVQTYSVLTISIESMKPRSIIGLIAVTVPGVLYVSIVLFGNIRLYQGRMEGLRWSFAAAVYKWLSGTYRITHAIGLVVLTGSVSAAVTSVGAGLTSFAWNTFFILFLLRFTDKNHSSSP